MIMTPKKATEIKSQVRSGNSSLRNILPKRAAQKGLILIKTKVLAAVFLVIDKIKKKKVRE
jgi:hypothetical protein